MAEKLYTRQLPLRLTQDDEKKLGEVMKLLSEKTSTGTIINALHQLPRYIKLYKETRQALDNEISLHNNLKSRVNMFSSALDNLMLDNKSTKKGKRNQLSIDD